MVDATESPEECAIRELFEETGYHGVVVAAEDAGEKSCLMFNDPGWYPMAPRHSGLLADQRRNVQYQSSFRACQD